MFEVDPLWPKPLPNHWLLGMTIGVSVDGRDHVWIVHRSDTFNKRTETGAAETPPIGECCLAAPPVLEFDQAGNLVNHWGGPGQGYEWPASNHGITVDHNGRIWGGTGVPGRWDPATQTWVQIMGSIQNVGVGLAEDRNNRMWVGIVGGIQAIDVDTMALGETVMFAVVDGKPAGLVGVADPIKPTTPGALQALRAEGLRIVMLTGDNRATAEAVARKVAIDEIYADVLPEQKNEVIRRLQAEARTVAMAGDGINDAPALAQADIGIAMGTGADVAMESAGITLVKGDLTGLVRARRLSEATVRNIKQNLFFAFVYNALGVPIAAGVLYPFTGLLLSPIIAAAAMSLSSVSVIGNALRLGAVRL